jgi:hypothetical protein
MTSGYFNGKIAVIAVLVVVWGRLPADGDELGVDARSAAAALSTAQIAIEHAADAGNLWLGTRDLLSRAAAYRDAGDYSQALTAAREARRHAVMALNQENLERARYLFSTLEGDQNRDTRNAIRGLLRAHDGAAALRLLHGSGD